MILKHSLEASKPAIRAVLLNSERAEQLLRLWEKQCLTNGGKQSDPQVLLAAAVLMTGEQQPSPAAALSVAQGLTGQPVLEALAHMGLALGILARTQNLSPAFASIILEAVRATSRAFNSYSSSIQPRDSGSIPT